MDNPPAATTALERFGTNMRALRTDQDLSLKDLSNSLANMGHPLSINTLSKIERGKRNVEIDDAEAIAEALLTTIPELLSDPDPERTSTAWEVLSIVSTCRDLFEEMDYSAYKAGLAASKLVDEAARLEAVDASHLPPELAASRASILESDRMEQARRLIEAVHFLG